MKTKQILIICALILFAIMMWLAFIPLGYIIILEVNGYSNLFIHRYDDWTRLLGTFTGAMLTLGTFAFGIFLLNLALQVYRENAPKHYGNFYEQEQATLREEDAMSESDERIDQILREDNAMMTRMHYHVSCAVAYMMAHPGITGAEMKANQDKLDKWLDGFKKSGKKL